VQSLVVPVGRVHALPHHWFDVEVQVVMLSITALGICRTLQLAVSRLVPPAALVVYAILKRDTFQHLVAQIGTLGHAHISVFLDVSAVHTGTSQVLVLTLERFTDEFAIASVK
jgi:hypothetical protein